VLFFVLSGPQPNLSRFTVKVKIKAAEMVNVPKGHPITDPYPMIDKISNARRDVNTLILGHAFLNYSIQIFPGDLDRIRSMNVPRVVFRLALAFDRKGTPRFDRRRTSVNGSHVHKIGRRDRRGQFLLRQLQVTPDGLVRGLL
jgi:hypothetical protein